MLDSTLFTDRVQKFKDARAEAAQEIDDYKQKKEQEYEASIALVRSATLRCFQFCVDRFLQHKGTTSTTQAALDEDTNIKLKEIQAVFEKEKDRIVAFILARAMLVHLELHRNLKKANA